MEFMAQKNIQFLPHAPYSLDLALANFCLLKRVLSESCFQTEQEFQAVVQGYLADFTKEGMYYIIEDWVAKMDKCIKVARDYVEK